MREPVCILTETGQCPALTFYCEFCASVHTINVRPRGRIIPLSFKEVYYPFNGDLFYPDIPAATCFVISGVHHWIKMGQVRIYFGSIYDEYDLAPVSHWPLKTPCIFNLICFKTKRLFRHLLAKPVFKLLRLIMKGLQ